MILHIWFSMVFVTSGNGSLPRRRVGMGLNYSIFLCNEKLLLFSDVEYCSPIWQWMLFSECCLPNRCKYCQVWSWMLLICLALKVVFECCLPNSCRYQTKSYVECCSPIRHWMLFLNVASWIGADFTMPECCSPIWHWMLFLNVACQIGEEIFDFQSFNLHNGRVAFKWLFWHLW